MAVRKNYLESLFHCEHPFRARLYARSFDPFYQHNLMVVVEDKFFSVIPEELRNRFDKYSEYISNRIREYDLSDSKVVFPSFAGIDGFSPDSSYDQFSRMFLASFSPEMKKMTEGFVFSSADYRAIGGVLASDVIGPEGYDILQKAEPIMLRIGAERFESLMKLKSMDWRERIESHINHPDVDFVLCFRPNHGIPSKKLKEECSTIRELAGPSMIDVVVPELKFPCGSDPDYSDFDLLDSVVKKVVDSICSFLPDGYLSGEPFGIAAFCLGDIAGRGANLYLDWTESELGREIFNSLMEKGLNISFITGDKHPTLEFLNGFMKEAVDNGVRVVAQPVVESAKVSAKENLNKTKKKHTGVMI